MSNKIGQKVAWKVIKTPTDVEIIGTFHGWGVDFMEMNDGNVNFSCAIVELENGHIDLIYASEIRFITDTVEELPEGWIPY